MTIISRVFRFLLQSIVALYRGFPPVLLKGQCRFQPTCSEYAQQAIHSYPPSKAAALIARRLMRCHPLSKGGWDPI